MPYVTNERNFQKLFPEKAKQWHPQKNGDLRPTDLAPYSREKVWWLCDKGHEYEAMVYNRSRGTGCPFCAGRRKRELKFSEWLSRSKEIGFGQVIKRIKETSSGNFLVEMPREAVENVCLLTLPVEDLGAVIWEYRTRQGMTQPELGQKVGLHRNRIIMLEKGKYDWLSIDNLKRIISVILRDTAGFE